MSEPLEEVDVHTLAAQTVEEAELETDNRLSREEKRAITTVLALMDSGRMPKDVLKTMIKSVSALSAYCEGEVDDESYDETFSMEKEVKEVLKSVRLLRKSILTPTGNSLKETVSVSEAKDVISMSNTMINTLVKTHEKIMNMERYRAVEQATVDVLRELDGSMDLAERIKEFCEDGKKGEGPLVVEFIDALQKRLDS